MTNLNKLKGAIVSAGYSMTSLTKKMGMNTAWFCQKAHNAYPFNSREISQMKYILDLTPEEIDKIFFCDDEMKEKYAHD